MHARKAMAKGFTLVEILIVVVILGILAAIVIPQFTNASESAKASSVLTQLQTLRSQIELYRNQHNNLYPTSDGAVGSAWDWSKLTGKTNVDGTTTGSPQLGPYLQQNSKNGFSTDPDGVSGSAGAAVGWVWSAGVMKASIPSAVATAQSMDTVNDVVTY